MATPLANAFYKKSKVILVSPLGAQVRLGSVGYFDDGQWIEVTTTQKMFGLTLSEASGTFEPNSFDGKGGKGFKFEAKLEGQTSQLVKVATEAHARAEITFGSEGAFVMNVKDQTVRTARELADLMSAIRYAYRYRDTLPEGERWEKKYGVIVGIASAKSVTAMSSSSGNASVVVSGSAGLPAPATPAQLDATMKISSSTESVDQLWQGPATRYAFQALRIDPSFFTRWDREDVVYLKPRDISFVDSRATNAGAAPKRPASYPAWARAAKFDPERTTVEILGPAGEAAFTGKVNRLAHATASRPVTPSSRAVDSGRTAAARAKKAGNVKSDRRTIKKGKKKVRTTPRATKVARSLATPRKVRRRR